jgi:plasmid maintenance system killer protein
MAIQSFGDDLTEKIFYGIKDKEVSKFPQNVLASARRKLDAIHAATRVQDMSAPPGNRLTR